MVRLSNSKHTHSLLQLRCSGDSELLPEMSFQLLECHSLITDALSCQSTWVTVVTQCITSPRCRAWLLRRTIRVYSICYNSLVYCNKNVNKPTGHRKCNFVRLSLDGDIIIVKAREAWNYNQTSFISKVTGWTLASFPFIGTWGLCKYLNHKNKLFRFISLKISLKCCFLQPLLPCYFIRD